ncbi:hypothetical protein QCA50_011202 [Cerrena zonata]|uniref:Uncharacterized protein n=1 Tax=Cerrena zonata TaxID=2478898 RepID=A0AAW0FH68_9APHY
MSATVLTSNHNEAPLRIRASASLVLSTKEKHSKIPQSSNIPRVHIAHTATSANTSFTGPSTIPMSFSHEVSEHGSPRKRLRADKMTPSSSSSSSIRRSERRKVHHPLGPRHLEYDYHQAHEELRAATIRAVYEMGYKPVKQSLNGPSTRSKSNATSTPSRLPTVAEVLAADLPYVIQARRKLDQADRVLQEALSNGQYWDNTPVPVFTTTLDSPPSVPSFLPSLRDDEVSDFSSDSSLSSSASSRLNSRQSSIGMTPPTTVASTPEPETTKESAKPTQSRKRRRQD